MGGAEGRRQLLQHGVEADARGGPGAPDRFDEAVGEHHRRSIRLVARRRMEPAPRQIDLKKDRGLTVEWADGATSYYTVPYLRKMSPSAEMRGLREEMSKNRLTVLPAGMARGGPLTAESAELVGNYALKIRFSDGHDTGIYSWAYLRSIDPAKQRPESGAADQRG
jgi:DUF971 family protein